MTTRNDTAKAALGCSLAGGYFVLRIAFALLGVALTVWIGLMVLHFIQRVFA